MAKKVKKEEVKEEVIPVCEESCSDCPCKILPITQEFGNGDLNVLRDKINELISKR